MKPTLVPGSVLVGVDGSPASDGAVTWAARYADAHRRTLVAVHGTGAPVVTDFAIDVDQSQQDLLVAGRRVVDHSLDVARTTGSPALQVMGHVWAQEPRELLVEAAENAHLLVLGTRGHGTVAGLLLGSVSVAVVAHAPCPVVVVRPEPDSAIADPLPIVVGADGTSDSAGALTFAFELASEQHRPLEVVHALGETWLFPAPDLPGPEVVDAAMVDWQLLLAESLAGYSEKFPDVTVRTRLVKGSAPRALLTASREASTVVVGARGRGAMKRRLLGSVSRSVVEHAHCTVAVVRGAEA